ncbi:MAG: AAA family ATPase, partial [Clostridiales bacterium]|nr:AAA family ATPase [Clostridiales bacterium]
RPRRFGKTLNMSMLEEFFSMDYADRGDLFEGLSIWEDEKYRALQGTYPVISLSFARIKEKSYELIRDKICEILTNLYVKYSFIRDSEVMTEKDREFFDQVKLNMRESIATSALYQLSNYLYRYYGKKVIILLDEYDTPMQEAYVNGFWEELVAFTRSMFNSAFKTNPYLERAVMTGITRVSKESIFSDLNNLEVVTTTSDKYATSFGFTEEEVFASLDERGFGDRKEKVKLWYDGFVFGKKRDIYNPWSILNFLDTGKIGTYWANTSSNSLVGKLIREGNGNIKNTFEQLLKGETIYCPIDEQIVYNQLDNDEDAIWSLLLASGYVKVLEYEQMEKTEDDPIYELAITNLEVRHMFRSMFRGWFKSVKQEYNGFVKSLLSGDVEYMNEYMNCVAIKTFSYFDTGKNPSREEPERFPGGKATTSSFEEQNSCVCFYHGFVLGLMVDLDSEYVITSNRESGFGRYDVMIEPKDKTSEAIILEFKVYNPRREQTLEDTVQAALDQIEGKQYETELTAKGIAKDRIRKYGFAFRGKEVLIG